MLGLIHHTQQKSKKTKLPHLTNKISYIKVRLGIAITKYNVWEIE